ncbi:MAG: twin-arginine translocase subunit TatC [Candidatus Thermochlorobacter sp.]
MPKQMSEQNEMEFLDHLEELRWRLIKGLIAVVLIAAVCAYFADFIVSEIIIGPLKRTSPNAKLQNLIPYGQISLYLQAIFFSAVVAAFPIFAYQIWKFVEPGLEPHEKSATRFTVGFVSLCFFAGVAFGYFVLLPVSLAFFAGFGTPLIENNISIDHYISFFVGTLLTCGLVFELPFASYVLSKIGLLTPPFMRHYRRHAIVAILILAAIVTPSTDIVTQLVIAVPMILLYEVSIGISAVVQRQRERAEQAEKEAAPYLQS